MFINDLFNKKKKLKESNRAGNNKLRDKDDYLDKKDHLLKLLSMPNVPVEDKAVIKDRLAQLEKAAQSLDEANPHNFDSDVDYYAAQNAPVKRRSAPSDYPYSQEQDDDYFREIFRKKREAAKKAAQDEQQGVAEAEEQGFGEFPPKQDIKIIPPKKLKSGETYQDRNKYWQSQGQAPIYKTNEETQEEFEPTYGKSPEDLGGADAWYHRGCNPGKYGFERGTVAFDSYLQGYKKSDEGSAGGKQWESAATESDIDKHVMEMRHAGYDLVEGHGSYYCSTKKRMVQRKGPKQKRSS